MLKSTRILLLATLAGLSGCISPRAQLCWTHAESGWSHLSRPPANALQLRALAESNAHLEGEELWFRDKAGALYMCRIEKNCSDRACSAERFTFKNESSSWALTDSGEIIHVRAD
jgi:hypothetical protein